MNTQILINGGVDINHALELLGDMDMYNETMGDFLEEINEKLPKLIEYKNNNDMPNYAIIVHSIKSDSKYFGFTALICLNHAGTASSHGRCPHRLISWSDALNRFQVHHVAACHV